MNLSKRQEWLLVGLLQIVFILIAYPKYIFHPSEYIFDNQWDGLKSLFCWYSYIFYDQPNDLFHYSMMNYPFGEYVFYPDNTPIYCMLLRGIQQSGIIDLQPYAFAIHHYLFLSNFILCGILTYWVLSELTDNKILIFIGALALPWINPQFIRITFHFNLGYSWLLVLQLYFTIKQYKALEKGDFTSFHRWILWQIPALFISPLFHMYYLAINLTFLGFFWFFYWVVKRTKSSFKAFITHSGWSLLIFFLFLFMISTLDGFYELRPEKSDGYDWINWKWRLENIFMRNDWFKIPFIYNYKSTIGYEYETFAYLGAFALYASLLVPVFFYFKKKKKWQIPAFWIIFFFAGLMMLNIAIGERALITTKDIKFTNILNPFFYIHKLTDKITHFRCLSRFGWYFFWTFNITMICFVGFLIKKSTLKWQKGMLYGLSFLMLGDLTTTLLWSRPTTHTNLFTNQEEMADMNELFKGIDVSKYQAILPIPYFHGMCEDFDYMVDPDDFQCRMAFQASYLTHLPLMSSKMPRVPREHAKVLLEMVAYSKVDRSIAMRLNEKPILILINDERYHNGYKPKDPEAFHLYDQQKYFVDNNPHVLLKAYKQYRLMEWKWWLNFQ